jgi:hypothetical protein
VRGEHPKPIPFESEAEANAVLHAVTDEASFREFEARLNETQVSRDARLVLRKRRPSRAFAFVAVADKPAKVDFQYADGAARGRALWPGLWRAVKVQIVEASREEPSA